MCFPSFLLSFLPLSLEVSFMMSPPANISCLHCSFFPRASLCQALVTAALVQDDSSALLDTLSSSLLSAFSADEVSLDSGKQICSQALLDVSSLAKRGYLNGVVSASQLLADLISSYTVLSNATSGNRNSSFTQYPVNKAVSKCRLILAMKIITVYSFSMQSISLILIFFI